MRRTFTLAILLLLATAAFAETPDEAKIRRAALDYAESWYAGDADQMRRALHPDLAKRIARNGTLDQMNAEKLIAGVGAGHGKKTPPERQLKNVKILDVFGNTASVRLEMSGWIDYMHLAKFGEEWKIVNVLWELKPR
ncbi:MAG TPA: nuclear transport factor 2 family protein [Thermoanaerobaculia bacterium]|nr:nuclear transport factor 2 family protein [Thermoanaerobaculia bacterium]